MTNQIYRHIGVLAAVIMINTMLVVGVLNLFTVSTGAGLSGALSGAALRTLGA